MLTIAGACSRSSSDAGSIERTAFLPFDNQTGDASLDRWSLPVQAALRAMTGSRVNAQNEAQAVLSGAGAIAHGVLERNPKGLIRLTVELFDAGRHTTLRTLTGEGPDPLAAATEVAKQLTKTPQALGNRDAASIEQWAAILNAPITPDVVRQCRELLERDPGFSAGYAACGPILLSMPPAMAREFADRAYANRKALSQEAQTVMGQVLFQTGRLAQASEVLRSVAEQVPSSWNQIGYSEAVLGHKAAAVEAIEKYKKFGGDEANAVDSLGEVYFILKDYAAAEKQFTDCGARFPQTAQGRTAGIKAAAMRALQGDRAKAEEMAQAYFGGIKKQAGPGSTKQVEEAWRGIILEQDMAVMRKKVEQSLISVPGETQTSGS
ncbi:hypothetical protein F183_A38030 [Bryobacterales bacterium F-183]|nr:hypothetical protein F183_A38030 [Bryobacterales bacterium F-183]